MFLTHHVDKNSANQSQMTIRSADVQPPLYSKVYANWSPISPRKAMKPAGVSNQIIEPSPNPVHFNRPSPNSSPILQRKLPAGGEPANRQTLKSNFKSPANIRNQPKLAENFQSPSDSSNTCPIYSPQKCEDLQKQKKGEKKKVEPLRHNGMPMHFMRESWQLPNNKLITPVSRSSSDKSYTMIENMTENISEYSSIVSIVSSGVGAPNETQVQQAPDQASVKDPQSPTPWRKVKTPGDTSAKSNTASAGNKPSWRTQEELKNIKSESVCSVYNSAMISAKPQSVLSHQKQAQTLGTKEGTQQEQHPVYDEIPWRSPQAKRKEYNKPPTASKTKEVTAASIPPCDKSVPVISASSTPHAHGSTSLVSTTTGSVATSSVISTAPPTVQAPPEQPKHNLNIVAGSNLPHKPPLPVSSVTASANLTSMATTFSFSELVKTEEVSEITLVKQDTKNVEETTENVVTSTELKVSEKVKEEGVSEKSEDLSKEVTVTDIHKEPSVISVVSDMPPPTTANAEEQGKKIESHCSPPPPPPGNIDQQPHPPSSDSATVTATEPLPPPPPPICKIDDAARLDHHQPPPPPPPPKKTPTSQPSPGNLPIRLTNPNLQNENAEPSADFVLEPVTSRIQRFEKQSSFERDVKEKLLASAKPVGPWVKKTSSGPVQQDLWGDHTSQEKPWPEPPPANYYEAESYSKVLKQPQRQLSSGNASTSSVSMVLCQPAKDQMSNVAPNLGQIATAGTPEVLALQHKQLQKLMERPRTKSTGDYSHSYMDNGEPVSIGQEKTKSPLTPSKQMTPSAIKGDLKKAPGEQLFDPMCDPNNPRVIQFQDVSAAAFKIKSGIMNTPCTRSNMSAIVNMDVFFKKEFNQYTGSFKERGARYTLLCLSDEQKARGVIAASAGNHALALSYHGQNLGIPVTVVMPLVAPIMKVQACRQYGANILVKGNDIGECKEIALKMSKEQNLLYVNGYDHPHILAGQGTMGLEIVEQVSNIDAVIVPVGGGGLIAGVALAVKSLYPHVKVIGVESEKCASFTAALKAGRPVYTKAESSLADGLAVPMVGVNAFATAAKLVDKVVSVREEWIAIAILRLVEMEKAVVEGAGAAALAALLAGQLPELIGKRVVIPLCGGNIDTTVLGRCLERGLAADGRLVKFTVTVSDRPGGIADLTRLLANLGVSIKDMLHERAWIKSDIFSVEVKVLCETRDHEHSEELRQALLQKYKELRFGVVPE